MNIVLDMKQWVTNFVDAYRFEASLVQEKDTWCFWPFVKEQMLVNPCSIEILEFQNPYRLLLVFFFGEKLRDLTITTNKCSWSQINKIVSKFIEKYSSVSLDRNKLFRLLAHPRKSPDLMYGLNCEKNVCLIYFTQDVRVFKSWFLDSEKGTVPERTAKFIFHLNYDQSLNMYVNKMLGKKLLKESKRLENGDNFRFEAQDSSSGGKN